MSRPVGTHACVAFASSRREIYVVVLVLGPRTEDRGALGIWTEGKYEVGLIPGAIGLKGNVRSVVVHVVPSITSYA